MIHLLNGSTHIRVKNSEGCIVLDCGCAHTDTRWLQMCDEHYQEDRAFHNQAMEAYACEVKSPEAPRGA